MLSVKEKGILLYIVDHCKRIETKMVGSTRETLNVDEDRKELICFHIFQIGELAKKLEQNFLNKYNAVPWKQIKGMRDVVAHGYGKIDLDRVWKVASEEITPLKEYCESILGSDNNCDSK